MADKDKNEVEEYNLQGGQRHVVIVNGSVKAVAPGLRIVEATSAEKEPYQKRREDAEKPEEYGLPV